MPHSCKHFSGFAAGVRIRKPLYLVYDLLVVDCGDVRRIHLDEIPHLKEPVPLANAAIAQSPRRYQRVSFCAIGQVVAFVIVTHQMPQVSRLG